MTLRSQMLCACAVLALGGVALMTSIAQSHTMSGPLAVKNESRLPADLSPDRLSGPAAATSTETETPRTTGKADRLQVASVNCSDHAWPHVPHDCIVRISGTAPREAVRTITIETRPEPGVSQLTRMTAQTASR